MDIQLSHQHLESFCGDILPLRLLGVEEFGMEEISWSLSGDCVDLRLFTEKPKNVYDDGDFTDGILITFVTPGTAQVTATYQNKAYVCEIVSRERRSFTSEEATEFYLADMHIHTSDACSKPNARQVFTTRSDGSSPERVVDIIRDEGILSCHVISDHADLVNRKEFFRGFIAAEERAGESLTVFPGAECDIYSIEKDRYGVMHNNANEVVCLNASTCVPANSYREFLDGYADCPFVICNLAHPNVYNYYTKGKGDFSFHKNNSPRFVQMVRFVEIGDGSDRGGNLFHEYAYSLALDNGFHLSTTCSSDSHGPVWGYCRIPGNTVIMAKENSKEAFLDALMNSRAYASSSGNVKVHYSVNGVVAPATLPLSKKYRFHVEISYFHEDPTTKIIRGEVISNGGVTVKELDEIDFSNFDFEIDSNSASWFYLRLWDSEGRKTWSVPVWTGRAPYQATNDDLAPLDKTGFTAVDEETGESASILLCDDPYRPWTAKGETCSILIDMKEEKEICALGHYPPILVGKQMKQVGIEPKYWLAEFPCHYVISTSSDGEVFTPRAKGCFRMCGVEELVRFEVCSARYIRLEILSTIGKNSHRKEFISAPVSMAELTPFRKHTTLEMRRYVKDKVERTQNPLALREKKKND